MRTSCLALLAAAFFTGCEQKAPPPLARASSGTPSAAASSPPAGSRASLDAAPAQASVTPPAAGARPAPQRPLNVLLLTIDSLRADMPWTGYPRPIAPNLTRLAERSVVYTQAYSASSYTAKSVATMLTGRFASTLYRSGWFFANYSKANEFFTEALQAQGVRTIGGHAHMYFGRGKGLEQGFDVWELVPGITFDANTDNHVTSEKLTALAIAELGKVDANKQFFAWFHYMDPHDQYVQHASTPKWGDKNRDRYDSEVHHTDAHVGKLLDWCEKQPWWQNTVVVVSADHGEAFGENGAWKHAFDLWEVLVRVPWIWSVPGAAPRRIDVPRSHIDMAPTVMDLMGQPPLSGFQGESLVAELRGGEAKARPYVMTELAEDSHNPQVRAIRVGDLKLKVYGDREGWKVQLFDLATDPEEKKDLSRQDPERLAMMRKRYAEVLASLPIVEPYGGMKLKGGREAKGPMGPPK